MRLPRPRVPSPVGVLRSTAFLLVLAALILAAGRFGVAQSVRSSFFTTGQQIYDRVAQSLVDGHGFSDRGEPSVENPPVYPLAVAGAYWAGGRNWWSVAIMQTLFDLGSMLLLYLLGKRLFGRTAGLIAAFLYALYPYLAAQAAILMDTSLFVLLLLAYLYFLTRAADHFSARWTAASAAAAAGALLVRPTIAPVIVLTPALLAFVGGTRRVIARMVILGGTIFLLLLTPWTVRNELRFHAFVPTSAKLGENFYAGNSPHAAEYISEGKSTDLLRVRTDAPHPPRRWNQVKKDGWWFHHGYKWARKHPGEWAHALKVKARAFWDWHLNPKTLGDTHMKNRIYTLTYLPLLAVSVLAALLCLVLPGRRRAFFFLGFVVGGFTLVHVLVVGYTRLRAPLDPLLMAFAGWLLAEVGGVTVRAWQRLPLPVAASAGPGAGVGAPPANLLPFPEPEHDFTAELPEGPTEILPEG